MTIPHLMNCSHLPDGWCVSCVKKLQGQLATSEAARIKSEKACAEMRDAILAKLTDDMDISDDLQAQFPLSIRYKLLSHWIHRLLTAAGTTEGSNYVHRDKLKAATTALKLCVAVIQRASLASSVDPSPSVRHATISAAEKIIADNKEHTKEQVEELQRQLDAVNADAKRLAEDLEIKITGKARCVEYASV